MKFSYPYSRNYLECNFEKLFASKNLIVKASIMFWAHPLECARSNSKLGSYSTFGHIYDIHNFGIIQMEADHYNQVH